MPEFGEKQIIKLQRTAAKAKSAVLHARARFITLTKSVAYWASVVTVGVLISAIIADVGFGVEIFQTANAGAGEAVAVIVGNLIYYTIFAPVLILALIMAYILEIVLLYPYGDPTVFSAWEGNGFVNVYQVTVGWKLVRDVCNIFFSLILVIIAMASVLKIEAYSWKQMLPKFFIAAILINFSKSIAGIFTDFATIAMATFGSSFSGSFARGLVGGFGVPVFADVAIGDSADPEKNGSGIASTLLAFIAAGVMAGIFFMLMTVFAATLMFRIIMLWFLIVISPLAYISRILPLTQRYSSQWWEMFGRYVIVGPLVTFFLWLSLTMAFGADASSASANQATVGAGFNSSTPITAAVSQGSSQTAASRGITQPPSAGNFQATNPNVLANFMVATLMLLASLKLISQLAQEIGKYTGMLEQKSGAVFGRALERAGQFGVRTFSELGEEPVKDDKGNITKRGSGSYYLGQGLAALSATMGQPLTFFKTAVDNIGKSSDQRQRDSQVKATEIASNLRNRQVAGRQDTGGKIIGTLANVTGTLMGAGMRDGKVVWDNYLSGAGIVRGIKKIRRAEDDLEKINEAKEERDDLDKKIKEMKGRLTIEELPEAFEDFELANTHFTTLDGLSKKLEAVDTYDGDDINIDELNKDGQLDTTNSAVRAFLEGHIQELERQQQQLAMNGKTTEAGEIKGQIAGLQASMAMGEMIGVGDFLASKNGLASIYGGYADPTITRQKNEALLADVKKVFADRAKNARTDRDNLVQVLENTGIEFADKNAPILKRDKATGQVLDKNGKAVLANPAALTLRNNDELKSLQEQRFIADKYARRLARELAALAGDDGYETRKVEQEALGEAMKALDGVFFPEQLMERMLMAQRQGDVYGQRAALMRLQQTGNLNDFTQGHMAVGTDGVRDKNAGTSAAALQYALKKTFPKMRDRSLMEFNAELGVQAMLRGDYDRALGVQYEGGGHYNVPEQMRRAIVLSEASKQSAADFAKLSRFADFGEDGFGECVGFDKGEVQIAKELYRRFSAQLADPLMFSRIQPARLKNLLSDKVRDELMEVTDATFNARLRTYERQVGADGIPPVPGKSRFASRA